MCAALSQDSRFLPMSVANTGFLLDRLGEDCHPLQYLRELTQNSIEAIKRTGEDGQIVWDVDWNTFELSEKPVFKLSVTDTGDGMTGEELQKFINQLSSSASEQSFSGNYGVGAKIAAATRNRYGVIYLSWKNGHGSMIHLERNSQTGQYGLRQWRRADGTYSHYIPVDDDVKPEIIDQHGTKVVLLGAAKDCDTMKAPTGAAAPSRWIAKYLNSRYFKLPTNITIQARQGWENPRTDTDNNVLRKLTGQLAYLQGHAQEYGTMPLTTATAHWWILKDEKALTSNSGHVESSGHIAALYQDELYEMESGRAGMSKLQNFGILFGYRQVVIYIEPEEDPLSRLTTNTARTSLSIDKKPLPWSEWAVEFRENMPDDLYAFVQEKGQAASATDHSKSIRDRLKDILSFYKLSKYKPSPNGEYFLNEEDLCNGGRASSRDRESSSSSSDSSSKGGSGNSGNIYAIFEKKEGAPARRVSPDPFPQVQWVSVAAGTREPGFLEDRAAKFFADQNLLQINADFRVFWDMSKVWRSQFADQPGIDETITAASRNWFEQALVETVIGVQSLRNSKEWASTEIEKALSPEALTAAVMQRYHINVAVRRELGSKLGKLQKAEVAEV